MQDFLQDRPVLSPEEVQRITASPLAGGSVPASPQARIVRGESVLPAARPAMPGVAGKTATPVAPTSAHTSQVKTVMENGRIGRIIVTCSCGKVTEVACSY